MKTSVFAFAAFFFASVALFAQENKTNENLTYSNITELGIAVASPQGISIEATSVHGFSVKKTHHWGLGVGFGGIFTKQNEMIHMPIFLNYRLNFKPEQKHSPLLNISVGGIYIKDGNGFYSAIRMGYRIWKFSFSSGVSFMAVNWTKKEPDYQYPYDIKTKKINSNMFGFTIKAGFTF